MGSSIEITPELMAGFLDEAPEYLDMLDAGLMDFESKAGVGVLALETPEDQEQMNTMFRAAHSLKGLAAAFGFDKIKELTHRMETLFDQVRMGQRDLTAASFETLFRVFDRLKVLVQELADDSEGPVEIDDILAELDDILEDRVEVSDSQGAPAKEQSTANQDPQEGNSSSAEARELLADPELGAIFLETSYETIDELNQGLLGLEEHPGDSELLNKVFRCAHNIKGASGAVALTGMNRLTHDMETVFDKLRSGNLTLSEDLINAVFRAVDRLRTTLDSIRDGRVEDVADGELRDLFEPWVHAAPTPAPPEAKAGGTDGIPRPASDDNDVGDLLAIRLAFPDDYPEAAIQAYLIHNKINELGTIVSTEPDIDSLAGDTALKTIVMTVRTSATEESLKEILRSFGGQSVSILRCGDGDAESSKPPAPAPRDPPVPQDTPAPSIPPGSAGVASTGGATSASPRAESSPKAATSGDAAAKGAKAERPVTMTTATLRVDQERLDHLMNLGGELIINRARFIQVHGKFREVFTGQNLGYLVDTITDHITQLGEGVEELRAGRGHAAKIEKLSNHLIQLTESFGPVETLVKQVHDLRTSMFDFDEALHALTRVSDGIQKGIMSTRMVPVGPVFTRFRRVVRDITKSNGKKVKLVLRGEQTELDKRMIDELGDPLTHMVRNSVDHGIETPEVREAAGKDPTGTLTLEAYHRGNNICIAVTDDGAGVNLARVKEKILERELATPAQVETLSDKELVQYVFKPGFSTAETVTEVSGRGMGMDIVLNKLEKLSGTVDIETTPGKGTKVVIKLPLTLAILTSLVARIGRGVYALPLESVSEIITVRREEVQFIQRRRGVCVRERVIPLAWIEDIFRTAQGSLQTVNRKAEEFTVVIVGTGADQIGLVVDELLGQEDVVIKSIAENYRNVRGIAGASIRGDGSVSLILDIGAMVELASKAAGAREAVARFATDAAPGCNEPSLAAAVEKENP